MSLLSSSKKPRNTFSHKMAHKYRIQLLFQASNFTLGQNTNAKTRISRWAASWEDQQFANAKTKMQISFAVTAKLISAFVFATRIVYLYFLNPKLPVSSHLLCLYSPVCVGPVRKPHCWFSHEAAQITWALSCHLSAYAYNKAADNIVCGLIS